MGNGADHVRSLRPKMTLSPLGIFSGVKKQPVFRSMEKILKAHDPDYYEGIPPDPSELLSRTKTVFRRIEDECNAVFGPDVFLRGEAFKPGERLKVHVLAIDFDGHGNDHGDLHRGPGMEDDEDDGGWYASGWGRAAIAYQHEAGWDHAPDGTGVWMVAVLPSIGTSTRCTCNLIGFLIMHDRDKDGMYESLAHLWVAGIARRKGVAAQLLAAARATFPLKIVEGPFTAAGSAFLKTSWPEAFA